MRLMALDIGEQRIGIAVSESGILATPHSVLQRKSKREDFSRLQRMIAALEIERVIVGLPYSLSGAEKIGPQARRIKRYADALARTVDVPFEYFDESYSTVEAEAYLSGRIPGSVNKRKSTKRSQTPLDAAAAAVILQNYLNAAH